MGLDKLGYDLDIVRITVLESIDGAVDVVLLAYDIMGTTDTIDTNFAKIKDLLKQMSPEYEQYTEISKLKKFYSDSLSFYEFVSSPSGSFSQLAPTINGHISSLKQQKNDLSFVYED